MQLLVRNEVEDFDRWKEIFDAQAEPARAYGLAVVHLWRSADNPNEVFFILAVEDRARAEAFMARPVSEAVGEASGVIDGEFHFLGEA